MHVLFLYKDRWHRCRLYSCYAHIGTAVRALLPDTCYNAPGMPYVRSLILILAHCCSATYSLTCCAAAVRVGRLCAHLITSCEMYKVHENIFVPPVGGMQGFPPYCWYARFSPRLLYIDFTVPRVSPTHSTPSWPNQPNNRVFPSTASKSVEST